MKKDKDRPILNVGDVVYHMSNEELHMVVIEVREHEDDDLRAAVCEFYNPVTGIFSAQVFFIKALEILCMYEK